MLETISPCAKEKEHRLFKKNNLKICLPVVYLIYVYEDNLALNDL